MTILHVTQRIEGMNVFNLAEISLQQMSFARALQHNGKSLAKLPGCRIFARGASHNVFMELLDAQFRSDYACTFNQSM